MSTMDDCVLHVCSGAVGRFPGCADWLDRLAHRPGEGGRRRFTAGSVPAGSAAGRYVNERARRAVCQPGAGAAVLTGWPKANALATGAPCRSQVDREDVTLRWRLSGAVASIAPPTCSV
jgi:hypothetical protein